MSQHDPHVALRHMLDHASEAVSLLRGKSRAHLDGDRVLQLAQTRLVAADLVTLVPQIEQTLKSEGV